MKYYVQLAVSTLILLAVAKAAEEPASPGACSDASQCTVSLMQTDLRMKILKEEAAAKSPVKSMAESEGKPPPYGHVEGTVQSNYIQPWDVGEDHEKEKADDTAPVQLADKDKTAAKPSREAKVSSDTEHYVELKASKEYAEKSRPQQATSKKTIDVTLNSELQTQSHTQAENTAPKAHDTAPVQQAEKDKEASVVWVDHVEASSDTEQYVELKASSEYVKRSRPQVATSKEQSKTIDVKLNSELQTESHMKVAKMDETLTWKGDKKDTSKLTELEPSAEYAKKSRSEAALVKETKAGTIDVHLGSQLQLQSTAKAEAETSYTARAIAGLKAMVGDESGGLLIMLFVGVLTCICMTLVLMGNKIQDPNDKDTNMAPPPGAYSGYSARPPALNSAMAVPGANAVRLIPRTTPQQSLLPQSQRSLPFQQRTPANSQMQLPPGANMMEKLQSSSSGSGELPQPGIRFDLPPICPSLILPHTEARFMIQMDHLKRSWLGPLNILGTSGRKLLHALVCDTPDNRRCLMLASCGCEDDPRTCIFTPADTTDPQAELEVFGKSGKFYGWLEFPGGNQALLTHSGNDGETNRVLQIDMGNAADLRMSASTMDGKLLASAGRSVAGQHAEGKDTWKMQVKPGTDAVLITSCMLALIVLKPWPTGDGRASFPLPKGNSFTPQPTSQSLGARHTAEHEPSPRSRVSNFFTK